ncbi:MAG: hypothetical protein QOE83_1943 [Actinomycetota bacterium]|jgi:hypothetical protein|nr:hypothetical protein [Actinomycetota bacterium]
MRFGRRPLFFLAVAVISLLLLPPTPSDFRWVNLTMAGIALFWFVLLGIEEVQGDRLTSDETAHLSATSTNEREERP